MKTKKRKNSDEQALISYDDYGYKPARTEIFRQKEPEPWKPAEETSDTILKELKMSKKRQKATNELITKHMT